MLSVLVEETAKPAQTSRTMLSLLVVLFLISYGLLVTLVVEQDRTISAQRTLVHQLFSDSMELQSLKGQNLRRDGKSKARKATPKSQSQTPSSQEKAQGSIASKTKADKLQKPAPIKPPKGATDRLDERRALNLI